MDLTAPSTAGTYYYGACVDAVTDESDITNNCSTSVQVTVPEPEPGADAPAGSPTGCSTSSSRSVSRGGSSTGSSGAYPARAGDTNTVNNFRKDSLRELKKIKTAWPDLHYQTVTGALLLSPYPRAPIICETTFLGRLL